MTRLRFMPDGPMAIDQRALRAAFEPRAFGFFFDPPPMPKTEMRDGVALVGIRGPLKHHAERWGLDSYEAIRGRVVEALEAKPKAVVLCIDSPGGDANGCMDVAREIRALAARAGVPLYAHVEGTCASAAYALACAAERIVVSPSAVVGSIGVIDALVDVTGQDAMFGVRFELIASGARKTDGNPHSPITDEAKFAARERVGDLADLFFGLVAESRAGATPDALRGLEAGLVVGAKAVGLKLADEVKTLPELIASIAGSTTEEREMPDPKKPQSIAASAEYDDAIAKLRKAAESDDDEGKKAKKMLAVLEGDDDKSGDGGGDASAEGGDDSGGDDSSDDKNKSKAEGGDDDPKAMALAALREAHALRAERAAEKEDAERKELLASRPDFGPDVVKFLSKASIEQVREAVKTFPRGPAQPKNPLAATAATLPVTRGEGQGDASGPTRASEHAERLDVQMGLARKREPVVHDGSRMTLRTMTRDEARSYAADRAKKGNAR